MFWQPVGVKPQTKVVNPFIPLEQNLSVIGACRGSESNGMSSSSLFITGTDTGVGKTVLTALLVCHLRETGREVIASKPFCSGSREDVELLRRLQEDRLGLDEINPYFFPEPLAPFVATPLQGGNPSLRTALGFLNGFERVREQRNVVGPCSSRRIRSRKRAGRMVLIEGIGGVLVPLGKDYSVLDLIVGLKCPCIVVGRNALGTINHSLLTVRMLQDAGVQHIKVVLMGVSYADLSVKTNKNVLSELLAPIPVVSIPFLGKKAHKTGVIRIAAKKLKKSLAVLAK